MSKLSRKNTLLLLFVAILFLWCASAWFLRRNTITIQVTNMSGGNNVVDSLPPGIIADEPIPQCPRPSGEGTRNELEFLNRRNTRIDILARIQCGDLMCRARISLDPGERRTLRPLDDDSIIGLTFSILPFRLDQFIGNRPCRALTNPGEERGTSEFVPDRDATALILLQ